jgi:hypothetical protein
LQATVEPKQLDVGPRRRVERSQFRFWAWGRGKVDVVLDSLSRLSVAKLGSGEFGGGEFPKGGMRGGRFHDGHGRAGRLPIEIGRRGVRGDAFLILEPTLGIGELFTEVVLGL